MIWKNLSKLTTHSKIRTDGNKQLGQHQLQFYKGVHNNQSFISKG